MPSGLGYGISQAGGAIAQAIAARRARNKDEEATRAIINAILAGQQLTDTGTIDPEMAARLAPLGVNLGGVGGQGDVTRTNEQTLSDIIATVANKYPALAGQNLQALMGAQQQLVGDRKARTTMEGLIPTMEGFMSPQQIQAMVTAGNADPQTMVDIFTNTTKALTQSQASAEGGLLAELGASGQTKRGQEMSDKKELTSFGVDEQVRGQKIMADYNAAIQMRLADYRASLEKESPAKLTETQKGRIFSTIDDGKTAIENIQTQKNELRKIIDETIVTTNTIDGANLGVQVLPGVTAGEILEKSRTATLEGKSGFEEIKRDLINSGRMEPTEENDKKLKAALEGASPTSPGEKAIYSIETIQNINKRAQAQASLNQLNEREARAREAYMDFVQESGGLLTDPIDRATYDVKRREAETFLGVSIAPTPIAKDIKVTGVPEKFSPGMAGKALEKTSGALGKFVDAIGEDVSSVGKFLGGEAPESVAGVKTGTPGKNPRQELLDSVVEEIKATPVELDVVETLNAIDGALGDKKLTDKERIQLQEIIGVRNKEVGGLK